MVYVSLSDFKPDIREQFLGLLGEDFSKDFKKGLVDAVFDLSISQAEIVRVYDGR